MATLRDFRFGIEIETVGLEHHQLAEAIASACPGSRNEGTRVRLADNRVWSVVHDGSLSGGYRSGEIVSPILTYADLDQLQAIVRAVREKGARADNSCGIHVHVDGASLSSRSVSNLAKMFAKQEELLYTALNVHSNRRQYCQAIDRDFIRRLEASRARSMDAVRSAWYGRTEGYATRYDTSRYRGLNLNSLFYRGTVEFRLFNGTTHAGEIKAYVQLALAMVAKAANSKSGVSKPRDTSARTGKYDMRIFLLALGFIGPEFEHTRKHLLKHMTGSSAFRNTTRPRPAREVEEQDEEQPAAALDDGADARARLVNDAASRRDVRAPS